MPWRYRQPASRRISPIAVITGSTHGIGRVTARELAAAGRHVVMLCRDIDAARAVADDIRRQHPAARVDSLHCDLADLASVRSTALQIRAQYPSPALLINNAGVASTRHRMSTDGFELNFAINHLGHFLLTDLLRDRMADHGRIVIVASRSPLSSTAAPGCTSTNTSSLPR